MFIIIQDYTKIICHNLIENYEYKGINIYKNHDTWFINLKDNLYFIDNLKTNKLEIKEYTIKNDDLYYDIKLYVYESDDGINDFNLYKNQNFVIADDDRAQIKNNDPYLKEEYLYFKDGKLISSFDVVLNGKKYHDEILENEDIIEFLGIKIIYNHNYLYINSFNITNKLEKYIPNECSVLYQNESEIIPYSFLNKINELKLDDIEEYKPIDSNKDDNILKTLIPSIVMCLSTGLMAFINYQNNTNQNSKIIYIIMPLSMFITGVLVPIIFYIIDNHKYHKNQINNINNYLDYLKEYEDNLKIKIDEYLNSINEHFFILDNIKDKLFYAHKDSFDYMKLSLGNVNNNINLNYKLTFIPTIDKQLKTIIDRYKNINFPLFIDIKENKRISIISNNKSYIFKQFLLELSYKHHYDDLNIAIYSDDDNYLRSIYNLPHLFLNSHRLTLNSIKQLQELDQSILEKPLILFCLSYIKYQFSNDKIYIIYLSNDLNDVYKDSDIRIEYLNNKGYLYKDSKKLFTYIENHIDFDYYFLKLSKCYIKSKKEIFRFSNIYNNSINYYYTNNDNSLCACFAYSDDEIVSLDLHERKQGPHGLIGGTTGSGKSELIISLLLSLCIRYSPEYLNIVLIDYKGGGIKDSLSFNNKVMPHIVASIDNLENYALERLIIALNNECKYRQFMFKKLSNLSNTSIMNLDDYIKANPDKYHLDKLAHLLIVVDEFAQLKKLHPENIKELISISRVGRSLGLHLLLATQKPAGVIDEEIWSNSHFKIALKVFDEKDSIDIIKSKDAAYLNKSGSFILKVDNSSLKANSIYSKYDINDRDPYKVSILDNTLSILKTYSQLDNKVIPEALDYTRQIIEWCDDNKPHIRNINYKCNDSKYSSTFNLNKIVLGQIDDYLNNNYNPLAYEINDNILIYSNRKNEINSILNTLNSNCRQTIVISNNIYSKEYISDSIKYDQSTDIMYLFKYLLNNHNLDLCLVVEDISCLLAYDDLYLDYLCKVIRRNEGLKINFIFLTSISSISLKLINCFKYKVMIELNDNSELNDFYSGKSKYIGNSFYYDEEIISFVPVKIEEFINNKSSLENIIKHIPDIIYASKKDNKILLGYDLDNKQEVYSNSDIKVVSYDEELLNKYKNAYQVETICYENKTNISNTNNILWLGPGVFSQRLFIANIKNDLENNEALYIHNGHKYVLRSIDNA